MILKEINKRIVAIVTLCLFLLSTNGMVLFYHYCQHANTTVYSLIVDATNDQCRENADTEFHVHHPEADCCYQDNHSPHCCAEHKTYTKTLKLKSEYNFSDRQDTPKPIWLKLFVSDMYQNMGLTYKSLIITERWRELPPEKPLFQPSGTQLLTLYRTFKIAC